jgi:hypothetical protein
MSKSFSARPLLSAGQIDQYHEAGYLVYNQPVLPEAKFNALKAYFESLLAALPAGDRPEAMDVPHFMNPKLLEWAMADEVLDIVEPIVGPDIALFSTHIICKPMGV